MTARHPKTGKFVKSGSSKSSAPATGKGKGLPPWLAKKVGK